MTDFKIPLHKRFLYKLAGENQRTQIATVQKDDIVKYCLEAETLNNKESIETCFEKTFKHGSEFIKWIDTEWIDK